MTPAVSSSTVPQPPNTAGRNTYIDVLRGVAIFGVVCIHFGGSFANSGNAWTPSFYLGLLLNQAFSFGVPLFIFLAGLLAASSSGRSVSIWEYYRRRFWRIGVPYLAASVASYILLGKHAAWLALPDSQTRIVWLVKSLFFSGIEPTLYFIPLILQLYLLQPGLRRLPEWLHRWLTNRLPKTVLPVHLALAVVALCLFMHLTLAVLCYRNVLNYYTWGRPNVLFWLFYFFLGLHFRTLGGLVTRRILVGAAFGGLLVATGALAWDWHGLMDRHAVGAAFEASKIDYAYVRPEILTYNLAMVAWLAAGITLGWAWKSRLAALLGKYSLEIYLWHILLLYEIAWRHNAVLDDCKSIPECILIIAFAACLAIACIADWIPRMIAFVRQYRIVVVKVT